MEPVRPLAEGRTSSASGSPSPPLAGTHATSITHTQSACPEAAPDPLLGKTLGGCKIIEVIGHGAMGTVYRARQTSLDRVVALKTIRPELCLRDEALARFRREARTVGRFNSEHVVRVHEVGTDQGHHFIVMEYVGGGSLRSYAGAQPDRRLPPTHALRFLLESARGLHEAERLKIIHRDIKPGNLLLDRNGRVKIADFGIAKVAEPDIQSTTTSGAGFIGTPLYMSPEQASGAPLDHRSDMYSLGATFFHLLTGTPPVEGQSVYEVIKRKSVTTVLSPRRIVVDSRIPEGLNRLIERMTALRPEDRYASFLDLIVDIERAIAGRQLSEPRGDSPATDGSPGTRRSWGRTAAIALVSTGVAVAGLALALRQAHVGEAQEGVLPPAPGATRSASPDGEAGSPDPEGSEKAARALAEGRRRERIAALRERFASEGPTDALLTEAQSLFAGLPQDGPEGIRSDAAALLNDVGAGRSRSAAILSRIASVPEARPPFREIEAWWDALREVLAPPAGSGPELKAWLESQAAGHRAKLRERALAAARALASRARTEVAGSGDADAGEPGSRLDLLEESRATLTRVFPEGRGEWDELFPEARIRSQRAEIARRSEDRAQLRSIASEMDEVEARLGGETEWTAAVGRELGASIASVRKGLEGIQRDQPEAASARQRIERLDARFRERSEGAARVRTALSSLAERDLAGAAEALAPLHGGAEKGAEAVRLAAESMGTAFSALLEGLDLDAAGRGFARAGDALGSIDGGEDAARWAKDCRGRLERLLSVTSGMAPVRGGDALIPERGSTRRATVEAFFLDRYEVSVGEYRTFLDRFRSSRSYEEVRDLWPDAQTFEKHGRGDRLVPPYFAEVEDLDPRWPVEDVNFYQALAFLRWKGKDLPTLEEWFLAARGPLFGNKHAYDVPSLEIHRSADRPAPVSRSGAARGFPPRTSVHHLAGNVAEWCRTGRGQAQLVGGRYLDSDPRYFTGERRDSLPLDRSARGYGFRGVVRPRDFFLGLLPKGPPR